MWHTRVDAAAARGVRWQQSSSSAAAALTSGGGTGENRHGEQDRRSFGLPSMVNSAWGGSQLASSSFSSFPVLEGLEAQSARLARFQTIVKNEGIGRVFVCDVKVTSRRGLCLPKRLAASLQLFHPMVCACACSGVGKREAAASCAADMYVLANSSNPKKQKSSPRRVHPDVKKQLTLPYGVDTRVQVRRVYSAGGVFEGGLMSLFVLHSGFLN